MIESLLETAKKFTSADAAELYAVDQWGDGYFSVSEAGHLCVHPTKQPERAVDLAALVDELQSGGVALPVLVRFGDVLKYRIGEIHAAFQQAIDENNYQGGYRCIYPIKVNQTRQVVEEVLRFGDDYGFGLEAGSKPELLAVTAIASNEAPIICNGFKDAELIEMVVLAQKLGRNVIPVVEKYSELGMILDASRRAGVRPRFGIRVKLTARGSGRWQQSAGSRSKFGLTATELLQALDRLKAESLEDGFQLLHFHLGSQIPNIRTIKEALDEAARIYAELYGSGAGLKYFDVGGGLGVDYDGSRTNFDSSTNYTLAEYATDVVYHTARVCDETDVPHPTIISESGRALVAHHSMLVFNVLGVSGLGVADSRDGFLPERLPADAPQPLIALLEAYRDLGVRNALESWHDAQQSLDMAMHLFKGGYLTLKERCIAENLFWALCRKLLGLTRQMDHVPEELEKLDDMLSDTYFCNFSLFQSIPDSWAIGQLFPIMPIHRLDRRPDRLGVLADITCDSDGKIHHFIDRRDVRRTLPLHVPGDEPYYLGAFLVGAYQEILGDLHNLFGDTNAVHVSLDEAGEPMIETIVASDTVREVLKYVEFDGDELLDKLRCDVETAVAEGRLDDDEQAHLVRRYEEVLNGSTYLGEKQTPAAVTRK